MGFKKIVVLFLVLATGLTAFSFRQKKILIIGDSISMGYTPYVRKYFLGNIFIEHNFENAQHTMNGLKKIDQWLGNTRWDIIQFNFGLWDISHNLPIKYPNSRVSCSVEQYTANLDSIVSHIKRKSNAKLVYVTTTYVPPKDARRREEEVIMYNEAAKKVMEKRAVMVNDIYEQSKIIHNNLGKGVSDVHYTTLGYEKLSKFIIDFLEIELK
ncbi:MAG: SGNH/GDSL hydrolase family protein [Pedobacter sp.]|nr:SGNH/GDSL hydrolase family protein [Pedobacter sp.]